MTYCIFFMVLAFSIFAFGAEDENENKPKPLFMLDQSKLDSGAVLGGAEPDSDLVKKAEEGDVKSWVQLYSFYQKNRESEKADSALNKAAELGDIPSLQMIYEKTGKIPTAGLNVVIHSLSPTLSSQRPIGSNLLPLFSYMDYLSSEVGLEEDMLRRKREAIYIITNGVTSVHPDHPNFLSKDLQYIEEEVKTAERKDAISILGLYMVYRSQNDMKKMSLWLEKLKDVANKGDMLALKMVYRITGQVLGEGYEAAVNNALSEEKRLNLTKTGARLKEMQNSVMENIKSSFVAGDEGIILVLYGVYRVRKDQGKAGFWLDKLRSEANEGNVSALRVLYHITGEISEKGYNIAVNKILFPKGMGRSSVIDAKNNPEGIGRRPRSSIIEAINLGAARKSIKNEITMPIGDCEFSFR